MSKRLSRLQKQILITLYEKDKADEVSSNKPSWMKNPPYWHSTRDQYSGTAEGDVFHTLRERSVANSVKIAGKYNEDSFLPSMLISDTQNLTITNHE